MIIMVLDHTRDFFHFDTFLHDPLDANTTSIYLYLTRWVTNFCAPVFVFLAGISIFLQSLRKSKNELSTFLFKRGLWLIFVELVIINFSWTFDITFKVFILQVIWALGISMFLMGVLIRLPYQLILTLGLVLVCGHNLLDSVESTHHGLLWDLARNGNFAFHAIGNRQLVIIYPFAPWLGLMMLGYCFGKIYAPNFSVVKRKKLLMIFGSALLLIFVLLRYSNIYGDPFLWINQDTTIKTLMSFFKVNKYPPSLLFMCITIGSALLFLALFENSNNKFTRAISIYGRVPFFFYIIHFYLLHLLCMILFVARGHVFGEVTPAVFGIPFGFMIAGEGYSLITVYVIWTVLVIGLYPLCKWFSDLKQRKNYWWLSYL